MRLDAAATLAMANSVSRAVIFAEKTIFVFGGSIHVTGRECGLSQWCNGPRLQEGTETRRHLDSFGGKNAGLALPAHQ